MIKLTNITKIYNQGRKNEKAAINNINLEINKGEMIAIMGKSGAGKSTLLNILGCLDSPTEGSYYLMGSNIAALKEEN